MTLVAPSGTRYEPTTDDVTWLLRAVEAEGRPETVVAQTLVNGFMWARDRGAWSGDLADWVRSYAQPVNPRWFPNGDLYLARAAKAETDQERKQLASRAAARPGLSSRTVFSPIARDAVAKALSHRPALPEATDYAAPFVVRAPPWKALTAPADGVNRFWVRPAALGWPGYRIDGVVGTLPLVAVGLVVAVLLLGRA